MNPGGGQEWIQRRGAYSGRIFTYPKEVKWKQTLVVLLNCGQIGMDREIQWPVFNNFCSWARIMRLRPGILGPTSFGALKTRTKNENTKPKPWHITPPRFFSLSQRRLSWTADSWPSATITNSENLSCPRWCHKTLKNAHCWVGHRSSKHNSSCQLFRVFDRLGGLFSSAAASFFFFSSNLLKGGSVYL